MYTHSICVYTHVYVKVLYPDPSGIYSVPAWVPRGRSGRKTSGTSYASTTSRALASDGYMVAK